MLNLVCAGNAKELMETKMAMNSIEVIFIFLLFILKDCLEMYPDRMYIWMSKKIFG